MVIASLKNSGVLQNCFRSLASRLTIVFNSLHAQYIVLLRNAQENHSSVLHSKTEYLTDDSLLL